MFDKDILLDSQVPKKCEGCGVQCAKSAELMILLLHKHMGEHVGESLVGEQGQEFDKLIDEHIDDDMAEEVKQGFRQLVSEGLTNLDEHIENLQQEIEANALACSGVLKMRASKGDVTYTANICTSQRVYTRDGILPEHIPVHVRATSTNPN